MKEPNLRMLVVEDQGELRRTIVTMLKRIGATAVHNATKGEEALALFVRTPIDFVISEWNLPDMKGIDLLRQIRKIQILAAFPLSCSVARTI